MPDLAQKSLNSVGINVIWLYATRMIWNETYTMLASCDKVENIVISWNSDYQSMTTITAI